MSDPVATTPAPAPHSAAPADPASAAAPDDSGLPPGSPVLVTGGCGFIGRRVVQLLIKAGHKVRVLDKPAKLQGQAWPGDGGVTPEQIAVDLSTPESAEGLAAAVKGIRTVIHLAGVMQEFEGSIRKTNLEGSQRLIAACEQADVRRFIYVSSIGADSGKSRYLRACLTVEEWLQKQNRMEEIILRCSPVFGVGDHFLTPIIRLFRSKKPAVPILYNGWQMFNPIFVDDVATIIGKLVADLKSPPQVYRLGGVQSVELQDVMGLVQEATHRIKGLLHTPPFLTPLLLPLYNLLWPETRMTHDYLNTIDKDTLLVQGEDNQAPALLQSQPAMLERELPRVVEQTP